MSKQEQTTQTFGSIANLLGCSLPEEMEEGDAITDIIAIICWEGEDGSNAGITVSEGTNYFKAKGLVDDVKLMLEMHYDDEDRPSGGLANSND